MTTDKVESSKSGTGGGWGNTNDWNMTTDKGESSKSRAEGGWGNTNVTTDKGESSKSGSEAGWGDTDLPATWGVDITTTWGGGDTGGGWGGGGGDGWGGGKIGDNTSTSGNDQKGKSKEKEREDVEMRDPSPPRTVGSLKPISSRTKTESAPPPLFPARNTPSPSIVTSKSTRPIPLPLPSKQKKAKYEDGNLTKLAAHLSLKNKEAEQVQRSSNSPSALGPKGRADLFSQVLK